MSIDRKALLAALFVAAATLSACNGIGATTPDDGACGQGTSPQCRLLSAPG